MRPKARPGVMLRIPGYEVSQLLLDGRSSAVYRATRLEDGRPVILKTLRPSPASPTALARFKREHQLLASLASVPGVIGVHGLEEHERTWIIVLEDFGGLSLDQWLEEGPLPIAEVLEIGIAMAGILGRIHERRIIHKDVNPANIVYHPASRQVKLIDFGISTELAEERPAFGGLGVVEGTLAYISPEQTGRMNRLVDDRTDLYALGATLYHLATGELPFTERDPLALVHCHIARHPLAPRLRKEGVPEALSDIVMKLMAKDVAARYQSAWGLGADLEACAAAWRAEGRADRFPLGRHDRPTRFRVPERLYAREIEVAQLLAVFERAAEGGAETLLVSGPPGIGKSMLVQEVYRPITRRRGYFAAGKFDVLQRNLPYAPIVDALRQLAREILAESDEAIAVWRERFATALGANAALMTQAIPELGTILGPQPEPPELPPAEAQNRLTLAFLHLLHAFAGPEHPLVLFLDDLQWADAASLELLGRLMTASDTRHTFLIGAYRDEPGYEAQPLASLKRTLAEAGVRYEESHLAPLGLAPLSQLVADALGASPGEVAPLAQLVLDKTRGNPFFVGAFLGELGRQGLLRYDAERGRFAWDLEAIAGLAITDNVVALLGRRAQHLQPAAQAALRLAACIGSRFDLTTLATVYGRSPRETAADLWESVTEGLVLPLGGTYRYIGMDVPGLEETLRVEYRFAHDRIQQAVYALIDEAELPAVHRRIGLLLLQNLAPEAEPQRIFDIVNQLNLGASRLEGEGEREQLVELNLRAARRAREASAFAPALSYARAAMALAPDTAWERRRDLMLALHVLAAEAAYLTSDYAAMDRAIGEVLAHAHDPLEQQPVYEIRVQALVLQDRQLEALETALDFLAQLGVRFPRKPGVPHILVALGRVWRALRSRRTEDLAELGPMQDPRKQAAIRMMLHMASPVVFARPLLLPLLICREMLETIAHGNAPEAGMVYGSWAIMRIAFAGDTPSGHRFAELAAAVHRRHGEARSDVRLAFTLNVLLRHWTAPLRESLPLLLESVDRALDIGDYEFGAHCARFYCYYLMAAGEDLEVVDREMERFGRLLGDMKQTFTLRGHTMWQQAVLCLMGRTEDPLLLVGPGFDERVVVPELQAANNGNTLCDYHLHKLFLALVLGEREHAVEHAEAAERYLASQVCTFTTVLVTFYGALARLALLPETRGRRRWRLGRQAAQAAAKLGRWAEHAPMNFRHRQRLVAAEAARVRGQREEARRLYDQAIDGAREHRWLQDEALACELAGRFHLEIGQRRVAAYYLHEAHYAYRRWGALVKVKDLEARYPEFRLDAASDGAGAFLSTGVTTTVTTGGSTGAALDLTSVLRASQAIAGEIVLERLLSTLMRIVVENAGARRGVLVLRQPEESALVVAATAETNDAGQIEARALGASGPAADPRELPLHLVQYVARTQECVVLDDAAGAGVYGRDPYVLERGPRSALCAPLVKQGQLVGVVYLENNLTSGAFTPERLRVVDLLASQAAVSIENALLYDRQLALTEAYGRFVPREILQSLGKRSILEVALGDQVQREMTVLFADVRDFTTLSEQLTPKQTFDFINDLLRRIGPIVRQHGGFIDKYIGDSVMALFPERADDAVAAAVAIVRELGRYNEERAAQGLAPIQLGVGVHSGSLMLGTIGETERMEGTVISDTVNTASRIEGLTKHYRASVLISEDTRGRLAEPARFTLRFLDEVSVKGRRQRVAIYEVLDGAAEPARVLGDPSRGAP